MRINKRYAMMLAALLCVANTFAVTTVKVKKAGTLGILLTQAQQDTCTSLAIKGKLNSDDIRILRRMAGYKEDGCSTGHLHTLNLAEAEFVTDKEPYMVLDAKEAMLAVVANPEFGIAPQFALGEPLQNNHVIHYERYQNREWRDYSNYNWNSGLYINRTELMQANRSSVSYNGSYYLGRSIEKPFQVINDQFFFSDNFTDETWKIFKRMGLAKFKGHRIEQLEGKYYLYASLTENYFPDDMFYGCHQLKNVILPSGIHKDDFLIDDQSSQVKYYLANDEMTIRYFGKNFRRWDIFPPHVFTGVLQKEKIQKHTGASASKMISILHNLKPMHVEWKKYRIDTRARFYIEYADGREAEDYYLDVDNMHVQKGKDRAEAQFFHASRELLDEMNRLGISTKPVKREKLE